MISLLHSIYDPGTPVPRDEAYYDRIFPVLKANMICPQVYCLMREKDLLSLVPGTFREALKQEFGKTVVNNLLLRQTLEAVLKRLDSEGLSAIPLKGIRFNERVFGHFAARPNSDIDLLIRPEDLQRAVGLLTGLGFVMAKQVHNHAVMLKPTGEGQEPLAVELHWSLEKPNWAELDHGRFWSQSVPLAGFRHVRELSTAHLFYSICLHGIRHRMDAFKFLLDIVHMIVQFPDELDYGMLLEEAARDKTKRRIMVALSIVYGQFPFLHGIKPLLFEPLKTGWTYNAMRKKQQGIRDREYYRYVSFFKFSIFDTWKQTVLSQKHIYHFTGKYKADVLE